MSEQESQPPFDAKAFLKTLTGLPGVYRMLDGEGVVIYVGKARNLKKRVASYFGRSDPSPKTRALVAQIRRIEVTTTRTEGEALLLENNLIKEYKPRYNILLRDDKGYPSIFISSADDYPRLALHRGAQRVKGRYFGPYPSAGSVRESLNLLQRLFMVRQCEDSFFRNRTRPCLQYQIKRCTAPCVGIIDKQAYQADVRHAIMFLEGKSHAVVDELVQRMEQAATAQDYETAAHYRDQIGQLRRLQEKQYVSDSGGDVDVDVLAAVVEGDVCCVQVFFIRAGQNLGNKTFYPKHAAGASSRDLLAAFIPQYYLSGVAGRRVPREILLNAVPHDRTLLEDALSGEAGHRVSLATNVRGERARWVRMAEENARTALRSQIAGQANQLRRFEALQEALELEAMPQRLECFDVSHTLGEGTVASCVVMDATGPLKADYRRFNIEGVTAGDDYAAMHQALTRRYTRLMRGEGKLPDMLVVDGGKGQVTQAERVLEELQVTGVLLLGVAKGPARRPGQEVLFLSGRAAPIILRADSPALHLIQHLRDEAHRFAITAHRQRRAKARSSSPLEAIPGLGPKRRQQLLKQFGGLQEVARAGVEELTSVAGISEQLAQRVFDAFHAEH